MMERLWIYGPWADMVLQLWARESYQAGLDEHEDRNPEERTKLLAEPVPNNADAASQWAKKTPLLDRV